ncbi:MAG: class I SAM-dependent RNA methyltransferase, partial [Rhodoluna sp.]
VLAELIRLEAKNLIYVACDPVALARDLGQLIPAGYKIDNIRSFDLFPHTHHFETVVSLVR